MLSNAAPIMAAMLAMSQAVASAPASTSKPASASGLSITAQLQIADTVVDRYNILSDDKDFVFDLGQNNGVAIANRKTFPGIVGAGMSFTAAKFPACSVSKLHIHPRAAEALVVISGNLTTETSPELGVVDANGKPRVITNELGPNMMTVFHQGAYHTQINPNCEEVTTITAFSSEDGGFGFVADQTLALPDDIVSAQLGDVISGAEIDRIRSTLSKNMGLRIDACLKKCNIKKREV